MTKLRRKIVLGVLASATVVFALTILIVGISLDIQVLRRADTMTEMIAENNGSLPEKNEMKKYRSREILGGTFEAELFYRLRFFTVYFDDNGSRSDLTHIASVDSDEAFALADTVKDSGDVTGYYSGYRFRVSEDGSFIVFLDNYDEVDAVRQLAIILSLVSLFFVLMITLVFWFLSKRIVQPFEKNSRMQKQFITDASHELKTPLAIISANAEVLAFKNGENEWINNITSQVERVSELVNELLALNRLEEIDEASDIEPVNLSVKANDVVDIFAEIFRNKNVGVVRDIQPDVIINGNASQLERLLSVLTENASKYVSENGEVRLALNKGSRYTQLSVFNTCELDKNADYSQLFDRFYRPDSSRTSKTGGHGVGLSIAKRIVTLHGGSIEAVPSDNGMSFNVKLSNKLKIKKK